MKKLELALLIILGTFTFGIGLYSLVYWINNPELTRMQVLLQFKWYYLPLFLYFIIYGIKNKVKMNKELKTK